MEKEPQSENSLHTIAIILLCCGAIKMLHMLGVISVDGESVSTTTSLCKQVLRKRTEFGRVCVSNAEEKSLISYLGIFDVMNFYFNDLNSK